MPRLRRLSIASVLRSGSATGPDYNPNPSGTDVTLVSKWRISDESNSTSGRPCSSDASCPATVADLDFQVPVDCTTTPGPSSGANCSANTSANALTPNSIPDNKGMVVQNFRVHAADSGPDGVRGNGDDRSFAMQGIYVP
jgi:hypothetical protein